MFQIGLLLYSNRYYVHCTVYTGEGQTLSRKPSQFCQLINATISWISTISQNNPLTWLIINGLVGLRITMLRLLLLPLTILLIVPI